MNDEERIPSLREGFETLLRDKGWVPDPVYRDRWANPALRYRNVRAAEAVVYHVTG